jgi:hypothetical protein
MNKSLSERIAARAVNKKPSESKRNQNRAIFLALRSDIIQALNDGWSVKSIWETLHEEGKVTFGYPAFWSYTNRLIRTPPNNQPKQLAKDSDNITKTIEPAKKAVLKTKDTEISGFTFNPSPKKEDLF